MIVLQFAKNTPKKSLLQSVKEKWLDVSGGRPKLQSWQWVGLSITAVLTYMPYRTMNFTWSKILPTLAYPIFLYLACMVVLLLTIKMQTRYIPEDFYIRWRQSVFWYSVFVACITFPLILLFLIRNFVRV